MKVLQEFIQNSKYKSSIYLDNNVLRFANIPEYTKVRLLIDVTMLLEKYNINHSVNEELHIKFY